MAIGRQIEWASSARRCAAQEDSNLAETDRAVKGLDCWLALMLSVV